MITHKICKRCNTPFEGSGNHALYCPICQKQHRAERQSNQYRDRKTKELSGVTRKIGDTDKCKICGQDYTITSNRQKYCHSCAPFANRVLYADKRLKLVYQKISFTHQEWDLIVNMAKESTLTPAEYIRSKILQ